MSRPTRPHRLAALVPVLAAAFAAPAAAATLSWNNATGGSIATATNWTPNEVPDAADLLVFNLPGAYTVTFPNTVPVTASLTVRRGTPTFFTSFPHALGGSFLMGTTLGDDSAVLLSSSTISAAATSQIGSASGAEAELFVDGNNALFQVTNAGADLVVGNNGTGTLRVGGGGLVRIADNVNIGNVAGSVGSVEVSGNSGAVPSTLSTENANGDLLVGVSGMGSLRIESGAEVLSKGAVRIGTFAGSTGFVSVLGGAADSRLIATTGLSIGGDAGGQVGGRGFLDVLFGGRVLSLATLDVGDPTGGEPSTLRLAGGTVHTRTLVVDPARGIVDFDAGTLRVDGGSLGIPSPLSIRAVGLAGGTLELVRGAQGTVAGGIDMAAAAGSTAAIVLDSSADLVVDGILNAVGGTCSIGVDSSATLTTNDRFYLAGTNSASLNIGVGALVDVPSMECTDFTGGTSSVLVSGAGARLRVDGFIGVGGDEASSGGPTTMTLQNGGAFESGTATTRMLVRSPGFVDVKTGSTLAVDDRITLEGRLRMDGGIVDTDTLALAGTGRLEARGAYVGDVIGIAANATIQALGNLELGNSASIHGYDFTGTLRCGAFTVRLRDATAIGLGDSTLVDGGTLISSTALLVQSTTRVVRGHGTIQGPLINDNGKLEVDDEGFASWTITGTYQQGETGVLALRVGGSGAGQFDRLVTVGPTSLNGTLRLIFPPGAALTQGVAIPLLTLGPRTGTFTNLVVEGFASPQALQLTYTSNQVLLTLAAVVEAPAEPTLPATLAFVGAGRAAGAGPAYRLDLPAPAEVRVEVFDVTGRRVQVLVDAPLPAGSHPLAWTGGRGIWFARATVRATAGAPPRQLSARLVVH